MSKDREEYGDWQTPYQLALRVCHMLKQQGLSPTVIFEPTCGEGHFIKAALEVFDSIKKVYAVEIYQNYIDKVCSIKEQYPKVDFAIFHQSIFDFDFNTIKESNILVLGNPPWVNNSHLSKLNSKNLPPKSNFKQHKGLEALTGKANFDIAEYILISLFKGLSAHQGTFALLVKNSVIKNIVLEPDKTYQIATLMQYEIDALKEFRASTSASLFMGQLGAKNKDTHCHIYNLYSQKFIKSFGLIHNQPIADLDAYHSSHIIDGSSPLIWRSGIKHDCAKVMELTKLDHGSYENGLKETFCLEEDLIYPLVKSSDIAKFKGSVRKHILITQKKPADDTSAIQEHCPLTYEYLLHHCALLDHRKSSIYQKRARFCIFGVGDYSFLPYKIVISAFYQNTLFTMLAPINGKSVMIDDTCYELGFYDPVFANITLQILNGDHVQNLIKAISFADAKRVITKDILMRIDLIKALQLYTYQDLAITKEEYQSYQKFLSSN